MKKNMVLFLVCIIISSLLVVGCNKKTTDGDEKLIIGVSQCTTQEERWRNDLNALEAVADELGVELRILDAANDSAKQSTDIENLVSSGVNAILISPTDAKAILPAIADAKKSDIPVVVWGRQVDSPDQDFFVINNFEEVGLEMGKKALEVRPNGKYFVVGGDQSTSVPIDMKTGIMAALQSSIDSGNVEIVFEQYITNWDPTGAMGAVENALTQNDNNVDLIICHNDGMAGGAIQALEEQGLQGKVPVIGMDAETAALQRIAEGKQYSTLLFDSAGFADVAMNAVVKLAKGEPIDDFVTRTTEISGKEVKTGDIPFKIVTDDNMKELIIDTGLQKIEDIYKNVPKEEWPSN